METGEERWGGGGKAGEGRETPTVLSRSRHSIPSPPWCWTYTYFLLSIAKSQSSVFYLCSHLILRSFEVYIVTLHLHMTSKAKQFVQGHTAELAFELGPSKAHVLPHVTLPCS